MNKFSNIIPAILEKDFSEVKRKISAARSFIPAAGRIQLDICDGNFIPNITWNNPDDLMTLGQEFNFSVHLMVSGPLSEFKKWLIGPVREVIVHYEAMGVSEKEKNYNFFYIQEKVKTVGKELGLALNPETPVEKISGYADGADGILFLAVNPGFQGSEFVVEIPAKVLALREMYKNVKIGVDGGINDRTLPLFRNSGADYFVSGSYVWKSENPEKAYLKLVEIGREL